MITLIVCWRILIGVQLPVVYRRFRLLTIICLVLTATVKRSVLLAVWLGDWLAAPYVDSPENGGKLFYWNRPPILFMPASWRKAISRRHMFSTMRDSSRDRCGRMLRNRRARRLTLFFIRPI